MNVLFDLRWMAIGCSGGMEQLAYEMVTSVSWLWDRGRLLVYCPRETFEEMKARSRSSKIDFIDSDAYELATTTTCGIPIH